MNPAHAASGNKALAPVIAGLDPGRHVLIAGPTAAGKSALAVAISQAQGGVIVNADALQVWACWRVLTARPDPADEATAPHRLYGHVAPGTAYSVGNWLGEVADLLTQGHRLIVAGGTGLYLTALTEGLAIIPPVPPEIRAQADRIRLGPDGLATLLAGLDPMTVARLDQMNPMRVQRAWEVLRATGRGLAEWQADTPVPLIAPQAAHRLVLHADRDWLAARIAARFDKMLAEGALAEVAALRPIWAREAQWARAIGAAELMDHLQGQTSLETAREAAITATRRYAKAQRSWFRNRMADWTPVAAPE